MIAYDGDAYFSRKHLWTRLGNDDTQCVVLFEKAKYMNISVSQPMLWERAFFMTERLELTDFKASTS